MVFRSHQAFDLGDALNLGVHLCARSPGKPHPQPVGSDFLTIQGVVVDCRVVSWGRGERFFEITLLFPSVDEGECALLVAASRRMSLDPPTGHQDDDGIDEDERPGFDRITGFN
jgi:hypothetical protein